MARNKGSKLSHALWEHWFRHWHRADTSDIAMQHKPHISINRALMDTLDEKVKEAFVDASPSHALSYNSVTKQACSLRPACCQHARTSLNSMPGVPGQCKTTMRTSDTPSVAQCNGKGVQAMQGHPTRLFTPWQMRPQQAVTCR